MSKRYLYRHVDHKTAISFFKQRSRKTLQIFNVLSVVTKIKIIFNFHIFVKKIKFAIYPILTRFSFFIILNLFKNLYFIFSLKSYFQFKMLQTITL